MPYTEKQITKTKERLEALRREDKKLSLQQLSELLEQQGVLISHTNLKNYEINDQYHDLYNRTKGMSLENFVALADVFGVSVDYLLGRSDSKKAEYHQMSAELKLDDETIDLIKAVIDEDKENVYYGRRIEMINDLLLNPDMLSALDLIREACYAHELYRESSDEETIDQRLHDKRLEVYETYLLKYGMKAVDSAVIRDLFISQALALIDNVIRRFPEKFVEDYHVAGGK